MYFWYNPYFGDDRELSTWLLKTLEHFGNWASNQFFVDLSQFTGDHDLTVASLLSEKQEGPVNSMGRLKEYGGSSNRNQAIEPGVSVFSPNRGKPMK